MLFSGFRFRFRQGLHDWLAVMLAELRSVRRLARTWVFLGLGIAFVGTTYAYYSYLHAISTFASLSGNALPRFTTPYFNSYVLWFFMAALVFLAFDLRNRDERDRIVTVLDTRPFSNLALVGGRLCAVVLSILLPLFAALLLVQAIGTIGRSVGWWVDPIEPVATFTFYFLDGFPALTLWCAIVSVLAVGLRYRLAIAAVALTSIGIHMWSFGLVPAYLLPTVSLLYIHDNWASDLAPRLPHVQIFLHRASLLVLAVALVVLAAALHKRPDGASRRRRLVLGTLLAMIAATGIATVAWRCIDGMEVRDSWLAAHEAVASDPKPFVEHTKAEIRIDPGEELHLEVEMKIGATEDLPKLLFSFNPGLEVVELRLGGEPSPFRHEQGLLIVEPLRPLLSGSGARLNLRATGVPDADFAYLDSAVDWRRESSRNAILWLGTAGGIFATRYVALMPGLCWLPIPGPNLDGASRAHAPTVDLMVEVPDGWLVAGPGRREYVGDGRFSFRPSARVPKVGLLAAPFERRATEVAGLELELLLHPSHLRNLEYYAESGEHIESRLHEIIDRAAELGIPYPYDGFTVVEVPAHLREYGGGHWLDTRLVLPGLLLLKEHGFPYANLWLNNDPNQYQDLDALKAQWLEMTFANPYASSSALRGLARNLVTYQTTAVGPGADALDFVAEELVRELFSNPALFRYTGPTKYTAHSYNADAGFGATVLQMVGDLTSQGTGATGFRSFAFAPPSLWDRILGASLVAMDFQHDPLSAIRAFSLRGNAVARSIFDGLGRERTAALLAGLRRHHRAFEARDFADAATTVAGDLEHLIGDWLNDDALPGFVVSRARIERVADDGQGQPRYEIRVHVRNDEPTPGLARLSLGISQEIPRSEPVRIEGNATLEIGMVSAEPPQALWLEPYLSLNRYPIRIDLDATDGYEAAEREPFVGFRSSTWAPPMPQGVVIDDLDSGFSTIDRREDSRLGARAATSPYPPELDQGLPTWTREPGEWSRAAIPTSWGKYRHTVAGALAGDGKQVALFAADLPTPGRWRLDYHIPNRLAFGSTSLPSFGTLGSFSMTLVANGTESPVVFDAATAEVGWNKLGEYTLSTTEARLEISSRTDGEMVIADAIRWVLLD